VRFSRARGPADSDPRTIWRPLAAGERVLARARTEEGWHLLATTRGVQHRGDGTGEAVPYQAMIDVRWSSDTGRLDMLVAEAWSGPGRLVSVVLREPGGVPATVRDRVQASILLTRRVEAGRRQGCTVAVRRAPDGEGPMIVQVTYDPGVDPEDPQLAAQVTEAVEAVSAQVA